MKKTYSRISTAYSLGKYDLVIKLAEKILSKNINDGDAYYYIAKAYTELVNLELAEFNIKKALSIEPNNINYLIIYCCVYFLKNEHNNCIELADKILSINPQEENAIYCKAGSLICLKNYKHAENLLKYLLKLAPNSENTHHYYRTLGDLYVEINQIKIAKSYYEKALELNPQDEIALNNYGTLMINNEYNTNNLQKALDFFKLSLRINPTNKKVINNYNKCLEYDKNQNKFFTTLSKAFEKHKKTIDYVSAFLQIICILYIYAVFIPEQFNCGIAFLIIYGIYNLYEKHRNSKVYD